MPHLTGYPFRGAGARTAVLCQIPLLLLLACHDAPRENPLDPVLTPPVELTVALDDTAGTATLTWTPYAGVQPFAEYRVLRNVSRSTEVETLARFAAAGDTVFIDTTLAPDTAYEYRVVVANTGGLEIDSALQQIEGYTTRAVHLLPLMIDPESGMVQLTWTRYRDPGFERYRVLRRPVGTDQSEELVVHLGVGDTTWADTTARHGVEYAYTVVVEAAGQTLISGDLEGRLDLLPVTITRTDFDSRTATVVLSWNAYRGPRFRAYQVWRRTAELVPVKVFETAASTTRAWIDTGLVGATSYRYQVVVATALGETVTSEETVGAIHPWLGSWPLAMDPRGEVRLYTESGDRIIALVAEPGQVRLRFYDLSGQVRTERVLVKDPLERIRPASVSMAPLADGRRLLSLVCRMANQGTVIPRVWLLTFGPEGEPVPNDFPLFTGEERLAEALTSAEAIVAGQVGLMTAGGTDRFDNTVVSSRGVQLAVDDFADGPSAEWEFVPDGTQMNNIAFTAATAEIAFRDESVELGLMYRPVTSEVITSPYYGIALATRKDAKWQDFRFEADLCVLALNSSFADYSNAGLRIGDPFFGRYSSFLLELSPSRNRAELYWWFSPPAGSGLSRVSLDFQEYFPVFLGTTYRLGLEVVDGRLSASVQSPVGGAVTKDESSERCAVAQVGAYTALVTGVMPQVVDGPAAVTLYSATFEAPVSQLKVWRDSRGRDWMGVCLPRTNRIAIGRAHPTPEQMFLSQTPTRDELGVRAGSSAGELFQPLWFDVGPDQRFFVLDAGNGRVQVFDEERRPITKWGRPGAGDGEFNFHSPDPAEPFAGSLCVDGEGYVWVADPGNQRIQKFAP